MKLITAIIRPDKLNDVLESLYHREVHGLTLTRCQGHGGEISEVATYRGTRVKLELVEKVRLEIAVSDPFTEITVDAIAGAARTGGVGDGKIFVQPLDEVVRIRTGERDIDAVTPAASG
jgi:nitrogen regulatory protein P-II 1